MPHAPDPTHPVCTYRVDPEAVIVEVGGDWAAFARSNDWAQGAQPSEVVGRSLWDFVLGAETRHLYEQLFRLARDRGRIGPIPFRCDAPDERRFLELEVEVMEADLGLTSSLIERVPRPPVALPPLARAGTREDLLAMCSMCKSVRIADADWRELEDALVAFEVFLEKGPPRLTHGLCPACLERALADLDS